MDRGSILCSAPKCGKVRKDHEKSCPHCGHDTVYIRIGWRGTPYRYYLFLDAKGRLHAYSNAQAIVTLREINTKIDSGIFDPTEYLTETLRGRIFENTWETWLESKEKLVNKDERSPETIRCYQSYGKNYLIPRFGCMDVSSINADSLGDFKDDLPDHLSPKYRKNIMKATEAFLRWCLKKHFINELPEIPEVKVKKARKMRAVPYEVQIWGINNLPEEHRDVYFFMRETALRISEVCVIKTTDIDLQQRKAMICRNISGSKIQDTTKGGEPKSIPLSKMAVETLRRNIHDLDAYIFINPVTGDHYRPEFMRRLWLKYSGTGVMLKEGGRHSTISDWANNGANAYKIKDLGRHADIRTSDIYVHNAMEGLYDIVDRKIVSISEVKSRRKKA